MWIKQLAVRWGLPCLHHEWAWMEPEILQHSGVWCFLGLENDSVVWASFASQSWAPVSTTDMAVGTAWAIQHLPCVDHWSETNAHCLYVPPPQFSLEREVMCTDAMTVNSVWRKCWSKSPVVLCLYWPGVTRVASVCGYLAFPICEWAGMPSREWVVLLLQILPCCSVLSATPPISVILMMALEMLRGLVFRLLT